jgi:hypothetical protein
MKELWKKLNNTYIGDTYITWGQAIVYGMIYGVTIPLSVKVSNVWIDKRIDKRLNKREP